MSRLRSLWFDSRHLTAGAPEVHAELDALGEEARAEVLAAGDRLASVSLSLAQAYCRRAPAARRLGAEAFRRWAARGEELAASSREAACSYFTLPPAALTTVAAHELDLWIALARRVLATSRRLGELFVSESGGVLGDLDRRPERLAAWVEVGLGLAARDGWEADLVALHFFAATALALPLFAPEDYPAWADLARAVERTGSGARTEFYASAPTDLHRLCEAERGALLRLACRAAVRLPAVGLELYFSLPAALAAFPAAAPALLEGLGAVAAAAPATLNDLLPVLRALLDAVPAPLRAPLAACAATLGARFPAGVVPFYRVLPRLLEHTGLAGIEHWIAEGIAVAAENEGAGIAYFGLHSRTSHAVLAARSTAVAFAEVEGLLGRYLRMLTGTSRSIAAGEVGYRPPFTGAALLFPARVDVFTTSEDNLRLYRLIAAQHAGRIVFDTAAMEPPLDELLASVPHAALAEHLLGVFEGARVDATLARAYRGLAADLEAVRTAVLQGRVRLPGTLDHLVRVLADADRPDLAAWARGAGQRLAAPDATASDSARAASWMYAALTDAGLGSGVALTASDLAELAAEASLEDALLDLDGGGLPGHGDLAAAAERAAAPAERRDAALTLELAPDIDTRPGGTPIDPADLLRLLEAGADLSVKQGTADDLEALGLYVTDLGGKLPRERLAELQGLLRRAEAGRVGAPRPSSDREFLYDEWDYRIGDYRSAWCRLGEVVLESDTGDFFHQTLAAHAELLPEIRLQFERIRPERYRVVHALEDGEDFDLDALVAARADRRSGHAPSSKLYQARQREERDVATLFLLDMSASTDEPVPGGAGGRRVIDITKEALVVMSEALEGLGDAYGIYGFSGHGRSQVEFYLVKHFDEPLTGVVKGRIGAIEPKRSTRMGTALRHAVTKLRNVPARSRHIILLSDGFPQDLDYGDDRRSNTYGIQDTMVAFQEAVRAGVTPFCITVDKAGHDYLKEICDRSRYLVIEDITALPRELPKIYQRCVRP